jgi:N,N'-diacetylchitobiose phosphorylase
MGTGDWNDGMNRVGREGRGESVWMGFFLYAVIDASLPLCEGRGDRRAPTAYARHRDAARHAL